ncbi:hypothetical protein [Arsenicicoccus dermatophilus]|uniref:hypothetical protein n=1 Tax=Arsenicicoccus dermatophilus TaxID=1076331 RepID=UPI0039174D68
MGITLVDHWHWWLLVDAMTLGWVAYCLRHRPDAGGGSYLSFPFKGWVVFVVLAPSAALLWILTAELVGGFDKARARSRTRRAG